MKRSICFIKLLFVLVISLSAISSEGKGETGEDAKQQSRAKHTEKKHKNLFLHYKPPVGRSMPVNREGAGTRGKEDTEQYLAVLVPNHVALTTRNQPSLFWYISVPTSAHVEITINDEASFEPVLETTISKPDKKGIQRLDLSSYNLSLSHGVEYQWFMTIVPDPERRSKDISATGMIKYIGPSKALTEKLAKANGKEVPIIYAEEGLWYDTLSSMSDLIDANPASKSLRDERISLLEQVGLSKVADYESK